jgi:hypothetical protein
MPSVKKMESLVIFFKKLDNYCPFCVSNGRISSLVGYLKKKFLSGWAWPIYYEPAGRV